MILMTTHKNHQNRTENKKSLKTAFHSRISLVAGEIFVSENHKNKSYNKFLQLIEEIIANDDHLYKQVSLDGL